MLLLINTNVMMPPIAPLGLDYIAGAALDADIDVEVVDLCLAADPVEALESALKRTDPALVAMSIRNVDDCTWPSAGSMVPDLLKIAASIREGTQAPLALGGVGFSLFPRELMAILEADFGVHGDGEDAIIALYDEVLGNGAYDAVPGLLWHDGEALRANAPAFPTELVVPTARDVIDNETYFRYGGQIGLETKRGCPRGCGYCADRLAKGAHSRLRSPAEVADEAEGLLNRGINVLHLCDCEFNIPPEHALAVCEEFIRRRLGAAMRWYAYLAVTPFDDKLAKAMSKAGCVGINFTADSASETVLSGWGHRHRRADLEAAVALCRKHQMASMFDLLFGGPAETPESVRETITAIREIGPDAAGAMLGVRIYPGTALEKQLTAAGPLEDNPGLRRRYTGRVDLLQPTFYINPSLGEKPAALIRELATGDPRFFLPADQADSSGHAEGDHNYNDHRELAAAIEAGARGAYWDILRGMRR